MIVAGDVEPDSVIPLVEKYWGDWKRGTFKVDIPQEPDRTRARSTRTCPGPRPTLPWVTVAFHGPAFSETEKDHAAIDMLMRPRLSARPPTIYKQARRAGAEGRPAHSPAARTDVDPELITSSRA